MSGSLSDCLSVWLSVIELAWQPQALALQSHTMPNTNTAQNKSAAAALKTNKILVYIICEEATATALAVKANELMLHRFLYGMKSKNR